MWNRVSRRLARHLRGPAAAPPVQAESPFYHYNASFDAIAVIRRFAVEDIAPAEGFLTNFLGVRIDPKFFPGLLDGRAGEVEGIPIPANWHADIAEWASALRAVELSRGRFRIVELGCGWGCWLNNTGVAARRRGLAVELIGVEGDAGHVAFAHEALTANGFAAGDYKVIHGIAAAEDGKALFPKSASGRDWGMEPVLDASPEEVERAAAAGTHDILDRIRLATIVDERPIDLLHIDIQGGEADFVAGCLDDLAKYVRRVLIGTHSREIEGRIMQTLFAAGWALEMERPAIFSLDDPRAPSIRVDGVQLWMKPALAG